MKHVKIFATIAMAMCLAPIHQLFAEKGELMTAETAIIKTNKGDITVKLDAEKAPITVDNFVRYAKDGYYDNTLFHRVIPGFMIQGGGFDTDFSQKETRENIQNEANNGLKNTRATLAMARTPDPHSASSQFFINLADNDFLNFRSETPQGYGYAVFGEVTGGMDVVDAIAKVSTAGRMGHQDVPVEDVFIEKVIIEQ